MLCLPSAQCPGGTGGLLPAGGASGASHHACCRREHTHAGLAGLEEQGWAGLAHFGECVSAACPSPAGAAALQPSGDGAWLQGSGQGQTWLWSPCRCCSASLHCCLWRVVQSGPELTLCGGAPQALALCVPVAPGAWGTWWWYLWHVSGAPCTQGPALGAEPTAVLGIASVQRLALSLTAVQRYGQGRVPHLVRMAPSFLWLDAALTPCL